MLKLFWVVHLESVAVRCRELKFSTLFYLAGQHRAGPYGKSTGPTPLFEDTSTESTQGMPGIPTGFSQYAGNEFLQGPMANVAVGYGAQMANQGKEYVEKHVCIKALYKM